MTVITDEFADRSIYVSYAETLNLLSFQVAVNDILGLFFTHILESKVGQRLDKTALHTQLPRLFCK